VQALGRTAQADDPEGGWAALAALILLLAVGSLTVTDLLSDGDGRRGALNDFGVGLKLSSSAARFTVNGEWTGRDSPPHVIAPPERVQPLHSRDHEHGHVLASRRRAQRRRNR
jgi:hypothetical protein